MEEKKIKFDILCPLEEGVRKILGFLEFDVMKIIWDNSSKISVRDVFQALSDKRDIAYTTVMTTMDRLYKKGLLLRKKAIKGYLYWPSVSEEELEKHIVRQTLKGIFTDMMTRKPVMSYFLNPETDEDVRILEMFSDMIEKVRKEQG